MQTNRGDTMEKAYEKGGVVRLSKVEDWINFLVFRGIHLAAFLVFLTGISWRSFWIAFVLYWGRMFIITAGYHRYFSHRAYKTSRPMQFLIGLIGTTCVQKGPLWWAATHRRHHRYTDQPQDVHSPRQRGWWYAHMGWLGDSRHGSTDLGVVSDLARYPELHWLGKYHYIAPLLLTLLCYHLDGWSGVVVGMGISTVLFWHATFAVNSVAHLYGTQPFVTGDDSRNWWLLAILTMGEGWHNNHHFDQNTARQGYRRWWEVDLSYYLLVMLAKAGVIWDLRQPGPKTRAAIG